MFVNMYGYYIDVVAMPIGLYEFLARGTFILEMCWRKKHQTHTHRKTKRIYFCTDKDWNWNCAVSCVFMILFSLLQAFNVFFFLSFHFYHFSYIFSQTSNSQFNLSFHRIVFACFTFRFSAPFVTYGQPRAYANLTIFFFLLLFVSQ